MDLTVSIVNHNSLETLSDCLRSVEFNLENLESEIIVVDNLCEHRAGPIIRRNFPQIILIENQNQLGFGANHNQGISVARGTYVLILNPDVILTPDAVSQMIDFMEGHPETALCGPRLIDPDGTAQKMVNQPIKPIKETILLAGYVSNIDPSRLAIPNWLRRKATTLSTPESSPQSATIHPIPQLLPQQVPWINGACMFFRRSALEEIGGFDERFFLYFEESDWCLRATKYGKAIYYLPYITVKHIGGTSTRPNYLKYLSIYVESAVAYYEKHKGKWVSRFMRWVIRIVSAINWLRWSIIYKLNPSKYPSLEPWIKFAKDLMINGQS